MGEDFFDYESVSVEEEKLNFNKLTPCPNCKKPIPNNSTLCLYCGESVSFSSSSKKSSWIIVVVVIILITILVGVLI